MRVHRQFAEPEREEPSAPQANPKHTFTAGMEVEHVVFGGGTVESVQSDDGEQMVTVSFFDGSMRTFAASLVGDKLLPKRSSF